MEVLTPILCAGLPVQWDTGAIVFIDFRWTWQWRLMWLHLGMLRDNTKSHLRISKSTTFHLFNLPCTCIGCRVSRNPVTTQVKWLKMLGDNDMSLRSCSREVSKLTCNSAKDCMPRPCQRVFICQSISSLLWDWWYCCLCDCPLLGWFLLVRFMLI